MNNMNNQFYQLNNSMNNNYMKNKDICLSTMKIINMNQGNFNNNFNNNRYNNNSPNYNVDNKKRIISRVNSKTKGEKDFSVIFKDDKLIGKDPIKINCSENDLISSLIEKFYTKWTCGEGKKRANRYKFIFNGKILNEQITIREAGITINNNKINIVNKFDIIFKLYDGSHIKVQINNNELISDIIKKFIDKSGYESKDIKGYMFDDSPLYENLTVGNTQLEDNSVVFVIVKQKIEKISISLLDRDKSIRDTECNINCPINFKVSALFDKCYGKIIVFDDKKLEEDVTFKEAGITDNSKIYYITDDIIQLYFAKSGGDISRKFYFDSKELNDNLTVKESGLMNNSKIIVYE